ncbi:putative hyaluronidase PH-20-like [Sesbania bispinosa]|nr:putative hyaluronidase PH-20-like [Sesbania bispinosa]
MENERRSYSDRGATDRRSCSSRGGRRYFAGGRRVLRREWRTNGAPVCGGRRFKVERRTNGGPFVAAGDLSEGESG